MSHPVAVLAIADPSLRQRLGRTLKGLRWEVVETAGGAEALAQLEHGPSQALILDRWLPDLNVDEFLREVQAGYPEIDLISIDGPLPGTLSGSTPQRSGRRGELMHAIRVSQEWDGAAHLSAIDDPGEAIPHATPAASAVARVLPMVPAASRRSGERVDLESTACMAAPVAMGAGISAAALVTPEGLAGRDATLDGEAQALRHSPVTASQLPPLPEFLGAHPAMLEVSRRIRLVAPRTTPVLVQGPSGTGKELVARAIHRLSPRAHRPFVVLNCAAIPESLLEAELFGHTRGAFTGAVQGRMGRIESANGGTLFLDEIGEMPLALQAKLLRFLEAGEIQRVGDNDALTVDVRVIAATHQPLARRARAGTFREDVFYRLAVFLIKTPTLRSHARDIPLIAASLLRRLSQNSPAKHLHPASLDRLLGYGWPGNVRELAHVLERAYILAEGRSEILQQDIELADDSDFEEELTKINLSLDDPEVNCANFH